MAAEQPLFFLKCYSSFAVQNLVAVAKEEAVMWLQSQKVWCPQASACPQGSKGAQRGFMVPLCLSKGRQTLHLYCLPCGSCNPRRWAERLRNGFAGVQGCVRLLVLLYFDFPACSERSLLVVSFLRCYYILCKLGMIVFNCFIAKWRISKAFRFKQHDDSGSFTFLMNFGHQTRMPASVLGVWFNDRGLCVNISLDLVRNTG